MAKNKRMDSRFEFLLNNNLVNSKRSQVTIFIIIALIIVTIIALIFLLKVKNVPRVQVIDENNPQGAIETCTRDAVEEAIERISISGADIDPDSGVTFNGERIVYICYSSEFYKPCTYQRPMLVEHIQKEITEYATPIISECFDKIKLKLEERYNVTDSSKLSLTTTLYPKHIGIQIKKDFQIKREDRIIGFDNFRVNLISPLYDFAEITMIIGNQQAKYCNFDLMGFMILYPSFDVNETVTGDSDRIYTLTERSTDQKFNFAIRSCPLPAGY